LESIPEPHKQLKIMALAGLYDNPIPNLFLVPIDFLKIPATVFTSQHLKSPVHDVPPLVYKQTAALPPSLFSIISLPP
jgi:hypothetical protein